MLDGLEPLQSGYAFDRGKVRDPALDTLLRGLARQSEGLCLITTREPLSDVAAASAELEVLYLLGLFDRPADAGCLDALRAKPPIPVSPTAWSS